MQRKGGRGEGKRNRGGMEEERAAMRNREIDQVSSQMYILEMRIHRCLTSSLSYQLERGHVSACAEAYRRIVYNHVQVFGGDSDDEELPPSGLSARQVSSLSYPHRVLCMQPLTPCVCVCVCVCACVCVYREG